MEEKEKPDTYAKAGVDIRKEDLAIRGISNWVSKTFKFRKGKIGAVMQDIGTFSNLIDMGDYALAICADSTGSKVLVAQELEDYDTIGVDVVAMNVNDIICCGAEPIAMVDYLAMAYTNEKIAKEISIGIYEGAKQAGIAVVGGETATLPEIISGIDNRGFDLAATVIGVVDKDKIITGERITAGDVVIGFSSTGIHCNGLTLARKILPINMWSLLLKPTRIYVGEVMRLLKEYPIHGMANITGGGLLNLKRITERGFVIDNPPEPQMVFKKIQELGKVSGDEMYRTFNMGIGFCIITDEDNAKGMVEKYGKDYSMSIIGSVTKEPEMRIVRGDREVFL